MYPNGPTPGTKIVTSHGNCETCLLAEGAKGSYFKVVQQNSCAADTKPAFECFNVRLRSSCSIFYVLATGIGLASIVASFHCSWGHMWEAYDRDVNEDEGGLWICGCNC